MPTLRRDGSPEKITEAVPLFVRVHALGVDWRHGRRALLRTGAGQQVPVPEMQRDFLFAHDPLTSILYPVHPHLHHRRGTGRMRNLGFIERTLRVIV